MCHTTTADKGAKAASFVDFHRLLTLERVSDRRSGLRAALCSDQSALRVRRRMLVFLSEKLGNALLRLLA